VRPERIVDGVLRKVGPVVFRCSFGFAQDRLLPRRASLVTALCEALGTTAITC